MLFLPFCSKKETVKLSESLSEIKVQNDSIQQQLPPNAIPFKILHSHNGILLKGMLNDTITEDFLFDTGATGLKLNTSLIREKEKLGIEKIEKIGGQKTFTTHENINIKIGDYKYRSSYVTIFSPSPSIIGMQIFKNKIIKICYENSYIQELKDLKNLSDYQRIKCIKKNNRLLIPIKVQVQDNIIEGNIMVDTGSYRFLFLNSNITDKYSIDVKKSHQGISTNNGNTYTVYNLTADSVQIGNNIFTNQTIGFSTSSAFPTNSNICIGLLGNLFWQQFTVIFDFKNNDIYLRQV